MRRFLIWFPAALGILLFAALAVPKGEVVTLYTVDAQGREHASALWVAEIDGALHLRSGSPETHWLARLRTHPLVELERGDHRRHFRAIVVDDPAVRAALNAALADKHCLADGFVRRAVNVSGSVPVRLEPIEELDDAHAH